MGGLIYSFNVLMWVVFFVLFFLCVCLFLFCCFKTFCCKPHIKILYLVEMYFAVPLCLSVGGCVMNTVIVESVTDKGFRAVEQLLTYILLHMHVYSTKFSLELL